jgi:phytoene dehydrogenase-like protein
LLESISVLRSAAALGGHDQTMIFFSDTPRFDYREPDDLANLGCGVICCPHNFRYPEPLGETSVRVTALASHRRWAALSAADYPVAKQTWYDRMVSTAARYVPDFRADVVDTDVFTPLTIQRFTSHAGGAVYGSPAKRFDGTTPWRNLFLCGNDQGLIGIVGALFSGVTMANRHLLRAVESTALNLK